MRNDAACCEPFGSDLIGILLAHRRATFGGSLERALQGRDLLLERGDLSTNYTLRGGGFPPDLIARMIEQGETAPESVATLGGRPMTLAMLQSADPAFRFENVASRLCRSRLAKLMLSLLSLTNPDNPNSARAVEGVPPSRWLSRLVELGMVEPTDLLDPWGRTFVFRAASGGTPRVVLSDRAPTFELTSPGPDGRAGTGDAIRGHDAFALEDDGSGQELGFDPQRDDRRLRRVFDSDRWPHGGPGVRERL